MLITVKRTIIASALVALMALTVVPGAATVTAQAQETTMISNPTSGHITQSLDCTPLGWQWQCWPPNWVTVGGYKVYAMDWAA